MKITRFVSAFWALVAALFASLMIVEAAFANPFNHPWRQAGQALVLDAYEKNPIDWKTLGKQKAIRGFIGKASDGLPPPYRCKRGDDTAYTLCKKTFQNYWLKRELYHTRKMMAKKIGLKWGAYHLGRPGNPIDQANHFVDFAEPEPDELMALDIEHDDPEKWISFKDAEIFVRHVHFRTGRYPVLYTNHDTAKRIAAQSDRYPLLSRLQLWYARFRGEIRGVFPLGNWDKYAMWQFSARANCNKRRCLYRVKGTQPDIDVNATGLTFAEFDKAWPFDGLVPKRELPDSETKSDKPEVLMVRNADPEPVVRFKMKINIKLDDGKLIKLASIAVPTARVREKISDPSTEMILAANFQSNSDAPQYLDNPETLHHLNAADKNDIAEPLETAQTFLAAFELADAGEQVQREVLVYQYTNAVHARHKRHHVAERYRY